MNKADTIRVFVGDRLNTAEIVEVHPYELITIYVVLFLFTASYRYYESGTSFNKRRVNIKGKSTYGIVVKRNDVDKYRVNVRTMSTSLTNIRKTVDFMKKSLESESFKIVKI